MALAGVRVVEFGGLAPVPFAGMILADWGATVIRLDRPQSHDMPADDFLARGKRSIALDVRTPEGLNAAKDLIAKADVLLDPYRPGVLEKLGLGPEVFLGGGRNERLVYARLAGFEPTGPNREFAGHDINYLAASGVLSILPKLADGTPSFPLNIVSDFAGGSHACVQGVLLALIERGRSGKGQVVSADMVSGARYVSSFIIAHSQMADSTLYINGKSLLGGDAPFYSVYACKCKGFISVGCLEPKFFKSFLEILQSHLPDGFDGGIGYVPTQRGQMDLEKWEEMRRYFEAAFKRMIGRGYLATRRTHASFRSSRLLKRPLGGTKMCPRRTPTSTARPPTRRWEGSRLYSLVCTRGRSLVRSGTHARRWLNS